MTAKLAQDYYGKSSIRMMKVVRHAERHEIRDLDITVSFLGDFESAYAEGDNSRILPTDTMRNTVYALGREHPIDTIESFALHVARHFVEGNPGLTLVGVDIESQRWNSVHAFAFVQDGTETETCHVSARAGGASVDAGVTDLTLLKTAGSGFAGFRRDPLTTLAETDDRLLRTTIEATWEYESADVDFAACRRKVRDALVEAFAEQDSPSVQRTLYLMGEAALARCPETLVINLNMPNEHCLLVDLSPFGLSNENVVFQPIDEPFGSINATIERQES